MKRLLLAICIITLLLATAILPMFAMPALVIADTSVDEQVEAGNCDAWEYDDDTDFNSAGDYIRMESHVVVFWGRINGGFVFNTVAIPNSTTITAAYIEVYIYSTTDDDANVDICGNDVDDANNFAIEADVTSRARTTATVAWIEDTLGVGWAQSPDISTVVQEIVNRVGWATGQDMCFLIDGKSDTDKDLQCRSYDWNTALAAKLHVEYGCIPTAAPTGITNDATNVDTTTARLNSYVSDDKGCPTVEVQFEWDDDMAGAPYAHSTGWIGDYETGDYPYDDISGLTLNTQHWFRAQFKNSIGTTNGAEKTFTTLLVVNEPSDFIVSSSSATTAELYWTKGTGATNTFVRRKVGSYPADETNGDEVYASTLSTCTDTGLSAGVTYYYRAWGESGGAISAGYVEMMLTMPLSSTGTGGSITTPTTPARWFQSPNPDLVSSIPGVILLDNLAISLDMPQATIYVIFFILIAVVAGIVVYTRIRNIPVAIITVSVVMVVMSAMGILPLWMIFVFIIMGTASGYALARG